MNLIAQSTGLGLSAAWTNLWGRLTAWAPGLGTVMAVIGMAIIAFAVGKYFWDKRRGQGGQGFPWMLTILGLLLCGPTIVIPVVLTIVQTLFTIIVNAINWFMGAIV